MVRIVQVPLTLSKARSLKEENYVYLVLSRLKMFLGLRAFLPEVHKWTDG